MAKDARCFAWRLGAVILLLSASYTSIEAQDLPFKKCPDGSFSVKYYKNQDLRGRPDLLRCEKAIDFDWGSQGPKGEVPVVNVGRDQTREDSADLANADEVEDTGGKEDGPSTAVSLGDDHFSAKWRGHIHFPAGDYTFVATADDGITVWIDGENVINAWRVQGPTEYRANRNLAAGRHTIEVFYFENDGGAMVRLRWERQ